MTDLTVDKCIICEKPFNARLVSDDRSLWSEFILHLCKDCGMAAIEFRHYRRELLAAGERDEKDKPSKL